MKFRTLFICGISFWPTVAAAVDVPQGEQERKAWCIQYGAPAEPNKPKFMTGSELNKRYWKDQLGEAEMKKQLARYEAALASFAEKTKANNERVATCKSWGYRANS
ncbi:hypothetical protein [Rhizobium sp.]|uniref:hypothetical protein n=1 Tax=Rhizobium sp. TaxID=391 RepID=UPI0028AE5FB0